MRWLPFVLVPWLAGCAELALPFGDTVSVGSTSDGWLSHGVALADEGPGYVRGRRGESTRYGTAELVAAIERAAARVAQELPGGAPLVVGDLSGPRGGRHHRHHSHESGRDVDLLFYAMDAEGRPLRAQGFLAYDRFGVGMPRRGEAPGPLRLFDVARNWALVRALLEDPGVEVQWIFCSLGVKARLLRYAVAAGAPRELLFQASWVLWQPSHGAPHDDHFHVRVRCSERDAALGCVDRGPEWTWLRGRRSAEAAPALDDGALVRALLAAPDSPGMGVAREASAPGLLSRRRPRPLSAR